MLCSDLEYSGDLLSCVKDALTNVVRAGYLIVSNVMRWVPAIRSPYRYRVIRCIVVKRDININKKIRDIRDNKQLFEFNIKRRAHASTGICGLSPRGYK